MANKKKWTIIIVANLENNSFLNIDILYKQVAEGIKDAAISSTEEVNFILLADKLRISVDPEITDTKYTRHIKDKYRNVSIYKIEKETDYFTTAPYYDEANYRRDDFFKEENIVYFLNKIKSDFPADNFGVVYKSHGGKNTDMFGRFTESILYKVKNDNEAQLVIQSQNERQITDELKVSIAKAWSKPHDERYWTAQDLETVEENELTKLPSIVLVTYKGKTDDDENFQLPYIKLNKILLEVFGNKGVAFFLFDCCWGMRFEMASLFYESVNYVVGSIDESPLEGIGYDLWTKKLLQLPNMKQDEVAKMLVAQYYISRFDDYIDKSLKDPTQGSFYHYGISMSCIDMSRFLQTAVNFTSFVDQMIFLLKNTNESTAIKIVTAIKKSREKCADFTYNLPTDAYPIYNIDMIWFLENIAHNLKVLQVEKEYEGVVKDLRVYAFEVITEIKLKLLISYCQNNYSLPSLTDKLSYTGGYGITITFPSKEEYIEESSLSEIANFPEYEQTGWGDFIILYFAALKKYGL